jgi:hypothetical protein
MPGNLNLPTENIDEVILRLLKLKPGTELDYQTYLDMIKKRLASHRMLGFKVPAEEDELLRIEFKRVSKLKDNGRFKVKERKVKVSPPPPPSGSRRPGGPNGNGPNGNKKSPNGPKTKSIVKTPKGKISTEKFFYEPRVQQVRVKDVTEKTVKVKKETDPLYRIDQKLDSIIKTLTGIDKENRKRSEKERKDLEGRSRAEREKSLEARPFEGIKKAISTMLKPFQSVWDIIKNFFLNIILGKIVLKLLDWFGDPKNQGKVKSLTRFLIDFGPALLAGFILFGTKFGGAVRFLSSIALKGILRLSKFAIPKIVRFIARNPIAAGIALVTAGAWAPELFPGLVNEKERETTKASGTKEDKIKALEKQKANLNIFKKLQGKGSEIDEQLSYLKTGKTKSYGFAGGGFGKFGPGVVRGKKGRDKIPAMLSDGEFVMSAGAVRKYGVDHLESMNAAGGGTNKPQMISGVPHAAGGGLIGKVYEGANRASGGNLKPVVDEIIRGLSSEYKWANDLARKTGVGINRTASNLSERGQRIAGEGAKMINPTIQRGQRIAGEGMKMINPTIQRGQRIAGVVKKKVDPAIQAALKFKPDLSGIQSILGNASGAAQEALPALLGSTLGISRTDKSISEDMQKSLLQARNTAGKKGRNYVDYKDYVGGGLSAGGLTMGRIADKEWKRDSKGRIIGLRQVYDTNRSAKEALSEAGSSWGKFFKSGLRDTGALGRGVYKPAEALLAAVQDRGKTMHDVNFSEKVLGFKPGKEVLNDTQRGMIAGQKNREALQNKRPWWDKMGLFGGASAQMKKEQMNPQSVGKQGPTISRKTTPPPIKPPAKPKVTVVKAGQGGAKPNSSKSSGGATKAPSFSANHGKTNTAAKTLGVNKK